MAGPLSVLNTGVRRLQRDPGGGGVDRQPHHRVGRGRAVAALRRRRSPLRRLVGQHAAPRRRLLRCERPVRDRMRPRPGRRPDRRRPEARRRQAMWRFRSTSRRPPMRPRCGSRPPAPPAASSRSTRARAVPTSRPARVPEQRATSVLASTATRSCARRARTTPTASGTTWSTPSGGRRARARPEDLPGWRAGGQRDESRLQLHLAGRDQHRLLQRRRPAATSSARSTTCACSAGR